MKLFWNCFKWSMASGFVVQLVIQIWTLTLGQFLIAGVMGKMIQAEVGNY